MPLKKETKPTFFISCEVQHVPSFKDKLKEWIKMIILFTNPSARAGYDTRSIFMRILTGLSSEFSFS